MYNALPLALQLLGVVAVAISLMRSLSENRAVSGTVELYYTVTGGWTMINHGLAMPIELLASTVCTPWVIVLHYRDQLRRFRILLLFRDAVGEEWFRRLTVALRIAASS